MMELWSKKLLQTGGKKEILYYGYTGEMFANKVYYYAKPSLDGLYAHKNEGSFPYIATLKATDSSQLVSTGLPNQTYNDGYFNLTEDSVGVVAVGFQHTLLRDTSLDLYK